MAKRLLIFDFDGVLSVKWTMPEKPLLQIPNTIKQLSTDHILSVGSKSTLKEIFQYFLKRKK